MGRSIWEQLIDGTLEYAIDKVGSVSFIGSYAFKFCNALLVASFPSATYVNQEAFFSCQNLLIANIPNATTIDRNAFVGCTKLKEVSLANTNIISDWAFQSCYNLVGINLPNATNIWNGAFLYCSSLFSLHLTGSSVCQLEDGSAFIGTPISGIQNVKYGSIYVPASLCNAYKAANNWSFYADRFVAIEE